MPAVAGLFREARRELRDLRPVAYHVRILAFLTLSSLLAGRALAQGPGASAPTVAVLPFETVRSDTVAVRLARLAELALRDTLGREPRVRLVEADPARRPRDAGGYMIAPRYFFSGGVRLDSLRRVLVTLRVSNVETSAVVFRDSVVSTPDAFERDLGALLGRMTDRLRSGPAGGRRSGPPDPTL